jgi:hypothetical protein
MTLAEIRDLPTVFGTGPNGNRVHESIFRSYHCVQKVRELLREETPPSVILEIIDDIMDAPAGTREMSESPIPDSEE